MKKYHPDYEDTLFSRRMGEFSAEREIDFEKHLAQLHKSTQYSQAHNKKSNWATMNR